MEAVVHLPESDCLSWPYSAAVPGAELVLRLQDPVNNLAPAVLVSAVNVTHLKETEMELQKLRAALQRWALFVGLGFCC